MSTTTEFAPATVHCLFAPATARAIAHVGAVVTFANAQWTVHSVEGRDYYAFLSPDGTITVDATMTPATWIEEHAPIAMIVPAGHSMGDGFGREVYLTNLTRGVCLDKSYR